MPLFLGLDCGGTSTRAAVIDAGGKLVFESTGGPANLASTPDSVVEESLTSALVGCPKVDAVSGCFAGLLGDRGNAMASGLIQRHVPCDRVLVYPDYVAALAAAPAGTDVVVVAGTGSVICSWKDGVPIKTGGGGPLLGDAGSAFDVGRLALAEIAVPVAGKTQKASDEILDALEERFGTRVKEELPLRIHQDSDSIQKLAGLAPIIGEDKLKGRKYAEIAVCMAMAKLSWIVGSHIAAVGPDKPPCRIVLAGGLWSASPVFQKEFEGFLKGHKISNDPKTWKRRQYHVERLTTPPVMGAALLAKRLFDGH